MIVGSKASQKDEIPACRPIATVLAAADGQQATAIGCNSIGAVSGNADAVYEVLVVGGPLRP